MRFQAQTPEEGLRGLHDVLAQLYRQPRGALFSIAIVRHLGESARPVGSREFLTGRVLFAEEDLPANQPLVFDGLELLEEWIPDARMAVEHLGLILLGRGTVAAHAIPAHFGYCAMERSLGGWPNRSDRPEWLFKANLQPAPGSLPFADPPHGPQVAFGKPAFIDGKAAVAEFIWKDASARDVYRSHEMWVIVPDSRARIGEVAVKDSVAVIEVEANIGREDLELQVVFDNAHAGSRRQSFPSPQSRTEVGIPSGAQAGDAFLVHRSGLLISKSRFSTEPLTVPLESHDEVAEANDTAARDIARGEREEVEFKPFIEEGNQKEEQILRTIVAFANTSGGRLYVGVTDDGELQGDEALRSIWKCDVPLALNRASARIKKLISDNLNPVPDYEVRSTEFHGHPIVVVEVGRSSHPPCHNKQKQAFVRRGATNGVATSEELRAMISRASEASQVNAIDPNVARWLLDT